MSKQLPKISESEQIVMKVIWGKNPVTAIEIVRDLSKSTDWNQRTIKTLINRLLKKDAIGYEATGREYSYFPLIEESVFVKAESQSFLKRVFGGAMKPMLAAMVENENLSKEDIEELKLLLDRKAEE